MRDKANAVLYSTYPELAHHLFYADNSLQPTGATHFAALERLRGDVRSEARETEGSSSEPFEEASAG